MSRGMSGKMPSCWTHKLSGSDRSRSDPPSHASMTIRSPLRDVAPYRIQGGDQETGSALVGKTSDRSVYSGWSFDCDEMAELP